MSRRSGADQRQLVGPGEAQLRDPRRIVHRDHQDAECDPATLGFSSTRELDPIPGIIGQDEAVEALRAGLAREEQIVEWIDKQGLDKAKFRELYNSFSVSSKARRASQVQDQFKVSGVPALGIAGRYYTDGELARNMDRALQVTDYLIAEARKAR